MRPVHADISSLISQSGTRITTDPGDQYLWIKCVLVLTVAFVLHILWARIFWRRSLNTANTKSAGSALHGELFRYGTGFCHVAFQSGRHHRHLILIPGLNLGFLSLPYTTTLASSLDKIGFSLIQPLTTSSYEGYGTGSLDRDAAEIRMLCTYLKQHKKSKEIVLMGQSTGCQDSVRFVKLYGKKHDIPTIKAIILQAPVSDQEYQESLPGVEERIALAKTMISEGKGEEILYRDDDSSGTPVTAQRYLAFAERYGDDDTFSSYFTDKDFKERLGHMNGFNCLIAFSGADEYVPTYVDKPLLCQKMVQAMGSKSSYSIIPDGKHELTGKEEELSKLVEEYLSTLT